MKDLSFERLAADGMIRDAVERCIERMAEAAVRLGSERLGEIAPQTPLHALRGLGNVLRHEYDRVNARLLGIR